MAKLVFQKQLVHVWGNFMAKLAVADDVHSAGKEKDYFDLVEEARQEWQMAISRFNQVTEPDLVDHAIYVMQGAERKYTYLLKKARQEGYRLPDKLDTLRKGR